MKNVLLLSILALMATTSCKAEELPEGLLPGDLIFQVDTSTTFANEIVNATSRDSLNYCHVGIYAELNGAPYVIEAAPKTGVTATTLADFVADSEKVVPMRVDVHDVPNLGEKVVAQALKLIGRPYDWRFAVGDSAIYCSELVQIAYREAAGREVFESIPMNFRAADGTMPDFWVKVFEREGCPIPQEAPGTNPNSIAAQAVKIEK